MSQPIEKNGNLYCPVCGEPVTISKVSYHQVKNGAFKGKLVTEVTYECSKCGWSYWTKS